MNLSFYCLRILTNMHFFILYQTLLLISFANCPCNCTESETTLNMIREIIYQYYLLSAGIHQFSRIFTYQRVNGACLEIYSAYN